MTKEEQLEKMKQAIEYYKNNTTESLAKVSKLYKTTPNTLKKYLNEFGVEVRNTFKAKKSNLDLALEELTNNNIDIIADKYGIAIEILEKSLNISKTELKKLSINLAIKEYVETSPYDRSIDKISIKYGINKKTLTKYLKDRNVEITKKANGYAFNEHIFNDINTEEKAYWLGFLYADGYITKTGKSVGLGLSIKDIDHMKKYNSFLDYPGGLNISETHQFGSKEHYGKNGNTLMMVRTEIKNENLWKDLYDKGCVPNKSLILTFPSTEIFHNDIDLILAFIRGYFDGDGTLGKYQHSKTNPNMEESLIFVGTKNFLEGVQKYLGKGFLMQKPNCSDKTYRLSYSTKKAFNAASLMYNNATIYLQRKYNIFINDFCHQKLSKNGEA